MFSSQLFWRIFTTQVLLLAVAMLAVSMTVTRGYRDIIENQFVEKIEQAAESLTDFAISVLENSQRPVSDNPLSQMAVRQHYEISVFDQDGKLVYSSPEPLVSVHGEQVLSRYLLDDERQVQPREFSTVAGDRRKGILRRIGLREQPLGYLQLMADRQRLEAQIQRLSGMIWGVLAGVSVLGIGFSLWVTNRLTQPIEELTRASEAITDGKLYQTIAVQGADELGTLTTTFNTMSLELSNRIQELEKQGQLLRENSERLATVLGGMVEGVIAVDSRDRILFANEAAFRMIEFDGRRVIGRPYWEVLRNTDVQTVVRDVLSGQFQLKREIDLLRSQSRIAFIASRLPGDPCPGVVLVLHDVTELRRLEKIRSEFVSNVGHELKTPLAAIQACTETLSGGAIEDPVHAEHFLRQITEHADRLHKLIIDLMELAKIESEEEVFQSEIIDIGIPIQEAIDEHYSVAQTRQIELTYKSTIEELPVLADPDGIRTIVNNLLDNALNYTPAGGKVRVEWVQESKDVVIKVIDTGIGIERKHAERIFERFYRVDSARSRDAGGTGLGLAIVKHLCQLFGGTIQVRSDAGHGSTFIIRFPLHLPTVQR